MNNADPRKAISKIIRERLANGEDKTDIFKHLQSEFTATDVSARFLAQWPYPTERDKNRTLNNTLLAILIIITIVKVISSFFFIWQKIPTAIPLIIMVPLINILLIYFVAKFNGTGYLLTTLLCGSGVFKIWEDFPETPSTYYLISTSAISVLLLSAVVLSEILRRRLLPNSTFFMRPKKDDNGDYIF